ncbi:eCIS core domain-containing protein [Geodermatophilus sp. SYSU D01176]
MATDVASADTEREPDGRPKALEEKADGEAAAAAAPSGGLGARQLRAKAAPGNAALGAVDDPAERAADSAADRVLRAVAATGPAPAPAPAPAPGTVQPVRRAVDPAAEQRLPGAPVATPTRSGGGRPGAGVVPDTTTPAGHPGPVATPAAAGAPPAADSVMAEVPTPAGEAPVVAPSVPSGPGPVESGTPAPEPEPPAPEGEAPARETPRVPNEVQDYLEASRGKGSPLPEASRRAFETAYGRPLDDVRLHDDRSADEAARAIGALAFTRGNDIYFRAGAYDPVGPEGKRLLAHELAHVVQQRPGVNRTTPGLGGAVVRRAPAAAGTATDKKPAAVPGTIDKDAKTITIDHLTVPTFKAGRMGTKPFELREGTREENPTKQAQVWRRRAKEPLQKLITARIQELSGPDATQTGDPVWYLQLGTKQHFVIGTPESIANDLRIPPWDKKGNLHSFDIDHMREAQLGGKDEDPDPNLWLLDSTKNRSAGSTIRQNIDAALRGFLANTAPKQVDPADVPSEATARKSWKITFRDVKGTGADVTDEDYWSEQDVKGGTKELVAPLRLAPPKDVERLRGSKEQLSVYDRVLGGGLRRLPRTDDTSPIADWHTPPAAKSPLFDFTSITFTEENAAGKGQGQLNGIAFKDHALAEQADFHVPIKRIRGVPWGGAVTPGRIDHWRAKVFSPMTFPELEFDIAKGFVGRGVIPKPSLKLLENVEIAAVLDGDLRLEAVMAGGDLKLPGPFTISGGSLTLSAGFSGLSVEGQVFFEIQRLATGFLRAKAATSTDFALEAGLDFDKKIFSDAQIRGSYAKGAWDLKGRLGVGPDKVKGIKRASVDVTVTDETVTATGEFETSLKGVDKGTLGFTYDPATGMAITGEILLGKGIPGIKGGKLAATVKEGTEGWSLAGAVTAEPDVPGLTGTVTGSYADGAFSVEADLGYERGQAKGTVKAGLTNRTLDAEGRPTGEIARDGSLTAYGSGTVTLAITPWLQGTVGLRLTPKGEIEVSGKVALPPQFDVFPEKLVERQILSVGIDIPIVGVAVAGQRIGIFATIRGGVTVSAGVGPGQLRDVALEVTYNPARPDDTTVAGSGTFVVPARAGMRLQVDGGIGAGIPVVSATAGVSVYGEVGVAGAASAGAAINWTPRTGIVLDARGELFVEPKFRFGIDAFVDVSADLLVTEVELYRRTWKLAGFEYGSNLRFGLAFPLHYESGKPFDLSFDQIQWTYPQINPGDVLGGLMKQLVG